ncbi:aldehyde dehydrogenase family protein, partial [Pseudofrankia sp. BMG5.36]|uniref:aldehyde dehydrogenase family protein n=1 Tax=Pseudofrankia sp. BMG5.36 TaxID=1834512 RepID=UPI0008DB076A
ADMDAAVAAARRAFDETDWSRRPAAERGELCARLAAAIAKRAPELAELITEEMGTPLLQAQLYQAVAPSVSLNYYARLASGYRFEEVRVSDLSPLAGGEGGASAIPFAGKSLVVQEPVGVVATFAAFNFALACAAQKAAPALVAGCTVVLKAPEQDPLSSFVLAELVDEVGFPPGVLNIVAAGPESSEYLVRHPGVDMVSFTGSTAVGRRIGEICGSQVKRAVLELGGKSAAIICSDADLGLAVPALIGSSVAMNTGQACVAMSRILAPAARYDEIANRLAAAISSLKVGDPMEPDTAIGPLITAAHRDRVEGHIARGLAEGATVRVGGGRPAHLPRGWYVEPTLLTDVRNDMSVAQEEIFGPVTALIRYEDEEDAIRIANDSRFGLAGTVFTADALHGFEIARRIRSGTFSVNTYVCDLNSPFGGYKQSGIGREHGVAALTEYLQTKTISVDPAADLPAEILAAVASVPAPV